MPERVIDVKGLVKDYDDLRAVNGIDFEVYAGEVFAFLGPNGAGKTTTVEIIETIRTMTSGNIQILGMDVNSERDRKNILQRIGVLPQEFSSFDRLTVKETIIYYSKLFNMQVDADSLMGLVQLTEHADKFYMNLSGGLKQKVGIAVSLVNNPEIVFLDEPTTGLDPRSRREVWDAIKGLKKEGKTIFLTTHYMEEAEVLADRVAIISKGEIIARGSPNQLIDEHCSVVFVTIKNGGEGAKEVAEKMNMVIDSVENGNTVVVAENNEHIINYLNALKDAGVKYDGMDVRKPNLEAVFLSLTGTSIGEGGEE